MTRRDRPVVPAQLNFKKQRDALTRLPLGERFEHIIRTNLWAAGSKSGLGSELGATAHLRSILPAFLARHGVQSILDVPCGDFGWLSMVDLGIRYVGADIVPSLVAENERRYGGPSSGRQFLTLDLTKDPLPRADLVLCRDCLVHLSFDNIERALANIRSSGAAFLLTTTFLEHETNDDIDDGDWRMVNLERPPFNLPPPIDVLVEECKEGEGAYADKALGLWPLEDHR